MKKLALRLWRIYAHWVCPNCNFTNNRGNVCANCGFPRPGSTTESTATS